MIRVSRDAVTPPSEEWLERAARELAKASDFYGTGEVGRFPFKIHLDPEVRDVLRQLFDGKCAFCEQSLDRVGFDVEHWRPKSAVMGIDGSTREPGYWWLATTWENLYASCAPCNRNKANRFPLLDEMARATSPDADLSAERPLLLDPCSPDERADPSHYLTFSADGLVASSGFGTGWDSGSDAFDADSLNEFRLERFGGHHPGQIVIDAHGLNRPDLVEWRRAAASAALARANEEPPPDDLRESDAINDWFERFVRSDDEFVLLQRQVLQEAAGDHYTSLGSGWAAGDFIFQSEQIATKKAARNSAFTEQVAYQSDLTSTPVEEDSEAHFRRSSRIARIRLVNFRCFEELDFSFGSGAADRAGWKMLLGENGVGKSSVLQAVALALMGEGNFQELVAAGLDPTSLRRREADDDAEAYVEVLLGADSAPRRMTMHPDGTVTYSEDAKRGSRTILLGFGSARWLYRPGGFEADAGDFIRVQNLFNPFVPLGDAVQWLLNLDDEEFDRAEEALLRLLRFDAGETLQPNEAHSAVMVAIPDVPDEHWGSLAELSDGYQTVLAMTGDIIELLLRKFPDLVTGEAAVLIDEIGAHLHPRWKMQVVSRLRDAFPQVQFLATTHEPLCLRGLEAGEIMVLRRDEEGGIEALDHLPPVDDLRVDQLLTSELFGLSTALDPDTEEQMNTYYELLAKQTLTDDEERELIDLRDSVGGKGVLGSTRRDQMIYEVVDQYVATARTLTDRDERRELSDETKRQVADIWESIVNNA